MKTYSEPGHVNVGAGEDITILDLTQLVCEIVGFIGAIKHDYSKPDGTPRKLISIDKIRALGWSPQIELRSGVASTYAWFQRHYAKSSGSVAAAHRQLQERTPPS